MASAARLRAPSARIFAPMMEPPQIVCRDFVLMVSGLQRSNRLPAMPLDFAARNGQPPLGVAPSSLTGSATARTRFRLLPTFFTAFLTAALDLPVFLASYRVS